ncbi:MAG TPA: AMP-binding protein [Chthoniobacteraceae bacterium]|jgi:phenylacetate-CoA ligase|nr:AMP-binding protein [Chthoniobacteraceae bacterium]
MTPLEKLRALIAAIVPANRFQTQRLVAAGVDERIASLTEFTTRVPFTTKEELITDQAAHPPFGSNLTFPLERYARFCQTSGTTARPLAILDTTESWTWMLDNWSRIYRAGGVQAGDRVYFAFSFGPFLGFWTAFEAAAREGFLCLPGGGLGSAARLRAMIQYEANVLCCTPTYALHLAEVAAREGLDLASSKVRKIFVAGEAGGSIPIVRERIGAAWHGAEVLDHYGLTEVGPVAFQESERPGMLHIIEDSYFPEIVQPQSGVMTPLGEVGELVLTTLGRTACPLLRYRTGDLVRRDPEALGFALAGGIIGRVDDMVVVRGVNIYPSAVDAVVRTFPEIAEYRVTVTSVESLTEISVEIESVNEFAAPMLESALTAAFALRIPVRRVDSLPRFELKAKRWNRLEA